VYKLLVSISLIIAAIIAAQTGFATNLPISSLPLGPAPSASPSDSLVYTNVTAGSPYRMNLYDLPNLPPFQSEFQYLDPMTTVGDLIYANSTPAPARLAGNASSTKKFLCGTGTGSAANPPSWCTLSSSDVPNNSANTTGTAANLTGIYAIPSPSPSGCVEGNSAGNGFVMGVCGSGSGGGAVPSPTPSTILMGTAGAYITVPFPSPSPSGQSVIALGSGLGFGLGLPGFATNSTNSVNTLNISGGSSGSLPYQSGSGATSFLGIGSSTNLLTISGGVPVWEAIPTWNQNTTGNAATATNLASTPAGILKGNGSTISAATAGTDYSAGTSALATGIVKTTTATGALTIAAASDIPSVLTTKGDTQIYGAVPARQSVPSDYGTLIPDSTQTNGWRAATYTQQDGRLKNYVQYADFENNSATGWTLGTIGTLTNGLPTGSPTFGSGASGNLSIPINSSSLVDDTYSLAYTSSAATTVGNMVCSSALPISPADQAHSLQWNFDYLVSSGASNVNMSGTSSNSYAVAVYDVTNSSWIQTNGAFNIVGGGQASGTFQTNATTASLRLCVYNANTTGGAATLLLDNFFVGRQPSSNGMPGTPWVAYAPTIIGFGTPTNVSALSRRVGDSLEELVTFTAGTSTAVQAQITLGYNGANANVTSSSVIPSGGQSCGSGGLSVNAAAGLIPICAQSVNYLLLGISSTGTPGFSPSTGNNIAASGTAVSYHAIVPIQGWSSNTVQSADSNQNQVDSQVNTLSSTTATAATAVQFTGTGWDTSGQVQANGVLKASSTGFYDWTFSGASTATTFNMDVYVNGVSKLITPFAIGTTNTNASGQLQLNYGDLVTFVPHTSGTFGSTTNVYVTFARRAGPAVVQASDSVNGRYHASSSTINGTVANITFSTKDYDTNNAYSGGTLTIPVSGKYQFNLAVLVAASAIAANNNAQVNILKNGSIVTAGIFVAGGVVSFIPTNQSDSINCLQGDLITVQVSSSATTPFIYSGAPLNTYFTWARVGN
jgi:hypothetical protein